MDTTTATSTSTATASDLLSFIFKGEDLKGVMGYKNQIVAYQNHHILGTGDHPVLS